MLLKTWKTGSPESQLEENWSEPWDVLLTIPTMLKLSGIKPWIHPIRVKDAPKEQWTTETQEDLKVIK